MSSWIEVDRAGLAQVIADRPKSFLLFELIQNALDENVTRVDVEVTPVRRGVHRIVVTDDSPDGYQDIRHAWTLYAPSKKKGNPELRGRFNVGCKMVLALAIDARVVSTKAAVEFGTEGRRSLRRRTERGTVFEGTFTMTQVEAEDAVAECFKILPPIGVTIKVFAGDGGEVFVLDERTPFKTCPVKLPTVFADDDGNLRATSRNTQIELHEPRADEIPMLYEMGIPVVELDGDDPYHVNVLQRVPLNIDRDNVTPAYLRTIRVEVLNAAHDRIDDEMARSVWATEASEDVRADMEAVDTVLTLRFSDRRVAYDPSDLEANMLATSKGYTVVTGGAMTAGQWQNAKSTGSIRPAGQVTPSPTVECAPDGVPPLARELWDDQMAEIAEFAIALARALKVGERAIDVQWYDAAGLPFSGAWRAGSRPQLSLNNGAIGGDVHAWRRGVRRSIIELLIHEFAHQHESNHLSERYHGELCRLATACLAIDYETLP